MAIHRANPTKIRPVRSPGSSGKKAQASPSCSISTRKSQKGHKISYHKEGRHDPIHDDAETQLYPDLAVGEDKVQSLVLYLAQNWIHHNQKTHG